MAIEVPKDDGWRIPDALWARIEPLLPPRKRHPLGCHNPRVPDRAAMDAILFVLRSGCHWEALNYTVFCKKSSAHRRFQEWTQAGVLEQLWALGLEEYDALHGLEWRWQAMDGAMTKAPLGGKKNRSQSHGSQQTGHETLRVDGRTRPADRRGERGRQCQRLQAGGSHAAKHPHHPARPARRALPG